MDNTQAEDRQVDIVGEGGYIPLFRKSLNSQVFQDAELWKVWCWCLLRASYKAHWVSLRTGRGLSQIELKEGQFIFGRHTAGKELRMKSSSVRNRMEKLKNMQNLTMQPDTHFSIVTICNWNTYKALMFENRTGNRTSIGQAKDRQRTHTIKDNKGNNIYYPVIKEVIEYLNQKTGKDFKDTTEANCEHIRARLEEGFNINDFKKVIDNKINDSYFKENPKYLNPETLFRPKNFEKYLNEEPPKQPLGAAGRVLNE